MVRDTLAVAAGFALWTVCWLVYNMALRRFGVLPRMDSDPVRSPNALMLLLVGSVVFSVLAGFAAALIASSASYVPIVILGVMLVAAGAFVQSRLWKLMPVWYHLTFLLLLIPATLAGGWANVG